MGFHGASLPVKMLSLTSKRDKGEKRHVCDGLASQGPDEQMRRYYHLGTLRRRTATWLPGRYALLAARQ